MLHCYQKSSKKNQKIKSVPILPIAMQHFAQWLKGQPLAMRNWLQSNAFTAQPNTWCLIPNSQHQVSCVVVGISHLQDASFFGALPTLLPAASYHISGVIEQNYLQKACIAWGMGSYLFTRYRATKKTIAKLVLPDGIDPDFVQHLVSAIFLVRDLINTPTEDMGPSQLAQATVQVAKEFSATVSQIVGDDLLKKNFPAIHTVGRASATPSRLIDLRWGKKNAPKVTLVGKGVCFDTGGLDIKSSSNMAMMKKDMGGAAHALALAKLIMQAKLPVRLRVLLPTVENAISGNAYRPGDIITMRKGITVEIGNTDAEGRLVLADALTEAATENPELLIDFSTLTGAARVAVGTDISAMFSNNNTVAEDLIACGEHENDPIWRLPLYAPYRKLLDSSIADINNAGNSGYAGAITAALFLQEFVPASIPWVHFDFMAWNLNSRPGHPEGGEAMALRAVFCYLQRRFGKIKSPL